MVVIEDSTMRRLLAVAVSVSIIWVSLSACYIGPRQFSTRPWL
jgi:hypothetical protein